MTDDEIKAALGDPSQGEPDLEAAGETLGVTREALEQALVVADAMGDPPVDEYTAIVNGIEFDISLPALRLGRTARERAL